MNFPEFYKQEIHERGRGQGKERGGGKKGERRGERVGLVAKGRELEICLQRLEKISKWAKKSGRGRGVWRVLPWMGGTAVPKKLFSRAVVRFSADKLLNLF